MSEVREILAILNTKSWYDRGLYVRKLKKTLLQ